MKKGILWMLLSFLLVTALVLASCGEAEVVGEQEEEEEEGATKIYTGGGPPLTTLSIGETFQSLELVVTVSEPIVTDSYEYYDEASESMTTKEAGSGMFFLIFTAKIENVGSGSRYYEGYRRFKVHDSEDNTFLPHLYYGENPLPFPNIFRAGEEAEGKVLVDIPEGASGLTIAYWPPSVGRQLEGRILPKLVEWVIE